MKNGLSTKKFLLAPVTLFVAALVPGLTYAQDFSESLERGSRPDTTAEQRYQTAIREAGGGLKVALAECRAQTQRLNACEREARLTYKDDMAFARHLRRDPEARPASVTNSPIRMTEVTTVREVPTR